MVSPELQNKLLSSIRTFESKYARWGKYKLTVRPESLKIEIKSNEGVVDTRVAKNLLSDFARVLKDNNLMIASRRPSHVQVDEYSYTAEEGLEDIADEIEVKLGNTITKLSVIESGGKPYVRFMYTGSPSEEERLEVRKIVDEVVNQYGAVDESEVFAEINFDDADEIDEMIEEHNLEAGLKADDSTLTGGKAENMTELQIAERHGVEEDYIKAQLEIGIIVESAHSSDEDVARDIALDNLFDLPDYYIRLEEMIDEADGEIPSEQDSPFVEGELDMKAEDNKAYDEVEVDYNNPQELADLYDNLYTHLRNKIGGEYGSIGSSRLDDVTTAAFTELHDYLGRFGTQEEDVDVVISKMTYEEIDGYVDIINKWM